ncbi:MAG TPA: LysE family transporter [Ktedonobacterales bacterium]|jgi:threonine/homoserine/homoserine lactone efflux protein
MDFSGVTWLARGLLIGLAIAAPVGPIGVLCIRRSLAEGWLTGFLTGMGAATADGFYGGVAAFGLTAISGALVAEQGVIRIVGGLLLCYLGARTLLVKPAPEAASVRRGRGLLGAYATTVGLTLTNPATIISFAAVFAGLGLAGAVGSAVAAPGLLTLGVFLGSACWWLLLSGGVSLLRARLTTGALRWVNRLSGVVLLGFGVVALVSGIFGH